MTSKFLSSKGSINNCKGHINNDNVEIMIGNDTDKTIPELFVFLPERYQEDLRSIDGG